MTKKIKNNDTVVHTWCGMEILPSEYYEIQPNEEISWANDSQLLIDISNTIAIVNNGDSDIADINTAINYLKNDLPQSITVSNQPFVTPTAPKNEYSIEPFGCEKEVLTSSEQACPITLSNKSEDGRTFTYNSDVPIEPGVGNYIFQSNFRKRRWIHEVDTENHTLTFADDDEYGAVSPSIDNGVCHYVKGYYVDSVVRNWCPLMYLWGVTLMIVVSQGDVKNDFVEFAIIDKDDMFKNADIVQAVFGCTLEQFPYVMEALEWEYSVEYGGHWTKYYDESWAINVNNKQIMTPDGAPGELLPGLYLRLSYFTGKQDNTVTEIFTDYFPTSKS